MRWSPGSRRPIDDRRGRSGVGGAVPMGIGGLVLLALLSWATGADFFSMLDGGAGPTASVGTSGELRTTPEEERLVDMVDAVAGDAQRTWQDRLGAEYQPTRVVLFRDAVESACGFAEAATGPFYCPADRLVYLDLGFFDELSQKFGASGDFAQAYVIAHEFGHHVQHVLGLTDRAARDRRTGPASAAVALELQADCFAGVWGHDAARTGRAAAGGVELETGDIEEGLRAAAAIGDDRLQRMATGRVAPDRFTHGTSAQRMEWFRRGLESGDPRRCDPSTSLTQ